MDQALENKEESKTIIPMIISKIQANMFTWDFHDENIMFLNASFFNSSSHPRKQNLVYTITPGSEDKRTILMRASKDILAGEEITHLYGLQGIKFLCKN